MQAHLHDLTARSRVLHAGRYRSQPALVTDAWLQLKEQQGHPITSDRLARIVARTRPDGVIALPAPPARTMAILSQLRRSAPLFPSLPPYDGTGGDAA